MNSGKCVIGGDIDESEKYIVLIVLIGVKLIDLFMENEVYQICIGMLYVENFKDYVMIV